MNALGLMDEAADGFRAALHAAGRSRRLDPPDMRDAEAGIARHGIAWDNQLFEADGFRRGHVECFGLPGRLSVLHVCVFPRLDDDRPIFGFDMVAGAGRVTGIFLDLSPVTPATAPSLGEALGGKLHGFAAPRAAPDWGDIFSPDFLAIRPIDLDEVARAIFLAQEALARLAATPKRSGDPAAIAAGQARYIAGQRRNEHTLRMLAGFIGAAPARRFIDEVLFPPVPVPVPIPVPMPAPA